MGFQISTICLCGIPHCRSLGMFPLRRHDHSSWLPRLGLWSQLFYGIWHNILVPCLMCKFYCVLYLTTFGRIHSTPPLEVIMCGPRTNTADQVNYVFCSYCTICLIVNRGIWAKYATEFVVSLSFVAEVENSYDCISKLILAKLGNPKRIRNTIQNDQVLVCNTDSQ